MQLWKLIEYFRQDLLYATRMLRRNPGFTAAVVLTLGLGIGANSAIFSTVDAVLLRPLPYSQPERLVQIWETHPILHRIQTPYPDYMDWRTQSGSFEQIAAYTFDGFQQVSLMSKNEPLQLSCSLVSENLLPMLGIATAPGRNFAPDEMVQGHDNVAILSHALWVNVFGSEPDVVGTYLTIDGVSVRVVGILPESGQFPIWADLLMPISHLGSPDLVSRQHHPLEVIGRLKEGVSVAKAQTEIGGIARRLQAAYPSTNSTIGAELLPLSDQVSGAVRRPLLIVMAAVGLVLLIACANVANLLLARAATREKEIATRIALGAARVRLLCQLLTESLLLSLLGSGLGLAVLAATAPLLRAWTSDFLPRAAGIGVNRDVFVFAVAVALLVGVTFGLAPAWQLAHRDQQDSLRRAGRNSLASSGGRRIRAGLVIAEIGMAVVVLTCAGLLLRSFSRLIGVNPGFRPDHVLAFRLSLPQSRYAGYPQVQAFYQKLLPELKRLPGVSAAELTNTLPLTGTPSQTRFAVEGDPPPVAGAFPVAQMRFVTPGYFSALVIALREGRTFSDAEMESTGPPACVINESMARRFYGGRSAIGRKVMLGVLNPHPQATVIVGVVADTMELRLGQEAEPQIYFPGFSAAGTVVLRTIGDPASLSADARHAVHAIDAAQPVSRIETMDKIVSASLANRRFSLILLGCFSVLALLLACTGLYGVIAYSVEQRTQELGLRQALGGRPRDLVRMIFFEGMRLTMIGLMAGTLFAFGATRLMVSLLYRTVTTDPLTFSAVALILVVVSAIACLLPAWRAANVDPMVALRSE